jgi:hypothetical protein
MTWLWMNGELERRRSWLMLVYNHITCLGTPKTMKPSRFESKPVLLTYTWTRTYLLRNRYIICISTDNCRPSLTVRRHCTTLELRIWQFSFKATKRQRYTSLALLIRTSFFTIHDNTVFSSTSELQWSLPFRNSDYSSQFIPDLAAASAILPSLSWRPAKAVSS